MTMTVSTSELETIRRKLAIKHCPVTLSLKLKKKVEYFQTKKVTLETQKNTYWLWHMK